jgi:AcrR family transcriptional regulator
VEAIFQFNFTVCQTKYYDVAMVLDDRENCRRPYALGIRLERSEEKRAAVLRAAREQIEAGGYLSLTMESLARASGVTRQTVHNLFKTKAGVLEALFDQLALDGGMERMGMVMRGLHEATDASEILDGFAGVFTEFWKRDRLLIRRIHGIAAVDQDFGAAVEARNQRRWMAAGRVAKRVGQIEGGADHRTQLVAVLYAMTSFEFFDALAEGLGNLNEAAEAVSAQVRLALARQAVSDGEAN